MTTPSEILDGQTPDPTPSDLARPDLTAAAEPALSEAVAMLQLDLKHGWISHAVTAANVRLLLASHAELRARAEAAERERDDLRLDITGGEDAPGHNASLSHQTIRDILAENYRSWRDSSDRYVTASDQLAAAREALEIFAIYADLAPKEADDECVVRLFYDDPDPEVGGPDTLLGELFLRAFRDARAALAPHPEKEEADHA